MPVSESNAFQAKYQDADNNINDILVKKYKFDTKYSIEPVGLKPSDFKPRVGVHHKSQFASLQKQMRFRYRISDKSGQIIRDANISFLLTRPQTRDDDQSFTLQMDGDIYTTPIVTLSSAGRYILRLKVTIGDLVGYQDIEGYLKPQ